MNHDKSRDKNMSRTFIGKRGCCSICAFIFISMIFAVYLTYFRHPPADELIRMNNHRFSMDSSHNVKSDSSNARQSPELDTEKDTNVDLPEVVDKERAKWENFLREKNYVSIGEVFDSCDAKSRKLVGQTIMLKDEKHGGVKTRTFLNFTTESDVTDGEFFIDVKYNDNDLFDNHWELCGLTYYNDDGEEEVLADCPYPKGFHSYTKDRKIPDYLPKGKFETNIWITDQNKDAVLCGRSIFVL
ncbi:hypothetical protein SNE40_019432 [Patella caerulea]|uniref:MD-2-related lipid-recognition domain-containing protein n=2 Tax=Patella caerulea TaxID=87958 RepID=A0AAN8J894_PATCE